MSLLLNSYRFGVASIPMSFVDTQVTSMIGGAGGSPLVVDLPTYASGDYVLIFAGIFSTDTMSTPAGWELIADHTSAGVTPFATVYVFGRRMDGSEGATVDITNTVASNTYAVAASYRGTHATTNWEAVAEALDTGADANPQAPDVTTLTANAWVVRYIHASGGAPSLNTPTGHNARLVHDYGSTIVGIWDEVVVSPGAAGVAAAPTSDASNVTDVSFSIVLKPS